MKYLILTVVFMLGISYPLNAHSNKSRNDPAKPAETALSETGKSVHVEQGDSVQGEQNESKRNEISKEQESMLNSIQIAAWVNGEALTDRDVAHRSLMLGSTDFNNILDTLIDDKVILLQAAKDSIKISDDELEKAYKERMTDFKSPDEFFRKFLERFRMTADDYRRDLKEILTKDKYLISKIGGYRLADESHAHDYIIDNFVSPGEIKEYFEANKAKYVASEKIKLREIVLKFTDAESQAQKKVLAEEILGKLQKGADFAELARQYSEVHNDTGGLWDWTAKGTFPAEVEDVAYNLKVGEIGKKIIAIENKFIIVKVEDKLKLEATFDNLELQEQIRRELLNRKINIGAYNLKQRLLKEAIIIKVKDYGKEK